MNRRELLASLGLAGVALTTAGVGKVLAGAAGMNSRHIVALGGSLDATTASPPAYLRYIMSLTGKKTPRILFVPTASGDSPDNIVQLAQDLQGFNHELTILRLWWNLSPRNWAPLSSQCDVVYIDDGNAKTALAVWRALGFDQALRQAWEDGVVLAGIGAGGAMFFEQQLTDAWADAYSTLPSLGLLPGSACSAYDNAARKASYQDYLKTSSLPAGYGIDTGAAIHFSGDTVERVFTAQPGATAHYVSLSNGTVLDGPLAAASRWDTF